MKLLQLLPKIDGIFYSDYFLGFHLAWCIKVFLFLFYNTIFHGVLNKGSLLSYLFHSLHFYYIFTINDMFIHHSKFEWKFTNFFYYYYLWPLYFIVFVLFTSMKVAIHEEPPTVIFHFIQNLSRHLPLDATLIGTHYLVF